MRTHSVSACVLLLSLDSGTFNLFCGHQGAASNVARDHSYYSKRTHFIVSNGDGVVTTETLFTQAYAVLSYVLSYHDDVMVSEIKGCISCLVPKQRYNPLNRSKGALLVISH